MSNLPELLEKRLNSSLRIHCSVQAKSADFFSELVVRSAEIELLPPNGWEIEVVTVASKIFMEFYFDDSARTLNNFYENRLNEVSEAFWATQKALLGDGFEIRIFSGASEVGGPNELESDARVSIKCSFKTDLTDIELISNASDFFAPVIRFTTFCLMPLLPDLDLQVEEVNQEGLPEGALTKVLVNKYERNPKNRNACLAFYGNKCVACGFDFGKMYGDFAANYIHVHHITPISTLGPDYVIDPIKDLVPLCPNCHAAVHLNNPPIDPRELKNIIEGREARN
jgi:5-methylcytosine-specific restriction protein A